MKLQIEKPLLKSLTQDGDIGFCRVCGAKHRLHRSGDTFEVAPTGEMGTAEQLKPRPEKEAIEAFIFSAPDWIDL